MTFNWKRTAIVLTDALLAIYLVLAITAFNSPDEVNSTCNEVSIHIEDGLVMYRPAEGVHEHLMVQSIEILGQIDIYCPNVSVPVVV